MTTTTGTTKFNEQDYSVEIFLDNGANNSMSRKYPINTNSIVNLNIEDTLSDWVTRGTMTIFYSFDTLENKPTNVSSSFTRLGTLPNFLFRNDGNDTLNIRIFPDLTKIGLPVDRKHWELLYKFSIYDTEDIDLPPGAQNAASANTKAKKLYFWDYWYFKMITNTLQYSTALSPLVSRGQSQFLTDSERSIPTGLAMKEIIEEALSNEGIPYIATGLVGGNGDWEDGASKIFYTAPATNTAYDTLMYLYSRHVSSKSGGSNVNDFSILAKERGPKENDLGYFSLKPVSTYFSKAGKSSPGEYQIERFFVQSYSDKAVINARVVPKSGSQNLQVDLKLGSYSGISNYRFVDISAFTNATSFRTSPVHSFDFKNRTYNVEFNTNSVTTARNLMVQNYISGVTTGGNSNNLLLLTLDENKKDKNIMPVFSLYGEDSILRQADGLQKLLKTGLFQNTCINFRVLGSTNRKSGRFIAIDREEGVEDNNFNNKFYGQWFIVNIRHIFEAGMYYNDITAIKIHRFKPADSSFVGTI